MSYRDDVQSEALDAVDYFKNEILEAIVDDDEAPYDIIVLSDTYLHENITDRSYDLMEAAKVLSDLSNWEETDSGLWGGQSPQTAVRTQAAYTYANAFCHYFGELMNDLNERITDALAEWVDDEELNEPRKLDLIRTTYERWRDKA